MATDTVCSGVILDQPERCVALYFQCLRQMNFSDHILLLRDKFFIAPFVLCSGLGISQDVYRLSVQYDCFIGQVYSPGLKVQVKGLIFLLGYESSQWLASVCD